MEPIDIESEGELDKKLIERRQKNKPEGKFWAVYVLRCDPPPKNELKSKINEEMGRGLEEAKETIRKRWKKTRSTQEYGEEEIEKTAKRSINRGSSKFDTIKFTSYIYEADEVYYVGSTNDIVRRITNHVKGNGAMFTKYVPPVSVTNIQWYDSEEKARAAESKTAKDIGTLARKLRDKEDQPHPHNRSLWLVAWEEDSPKIFAFNA